MVLRKLTQLLVGVAPFASHPHPVISSTRIQPMPPQQALLVEVPRGRWQHPRGRLLTSLSATGVERIPRMHDGNTLR